MKSVLITGGTGSFGRAFVKRILNYFPSVERIVIFSRDELKQWEMSETFPINKYPQLRYFIGDIRDLERLNTALYGIDTIVHAAALKHVPVAEYNPTEFIKTNINGTENVIKAALSNDVKRVVSLSTDKAAAPINLYGATKLCADKLIISANNIKGNKDINFSVVRYGNVMGSRGSVLPFFLKKKESGVLPITDEKMTRFNISLGEGVDMVLWSIENLLGGEILVPKIPSFRVVDLAEAIAPECRKEIVGIRPGEKIHEVLITESDSPYTFDLGSYYSILPPDSINNKKFQDLCSKKVEFDFTYCSGTNKDFLSVEQLRKLIATYTTQ